MGALGDRVPVHVETDGEIVRRRPPQSTIEIEALRREDGKVAGWRFDIDGVAEITQRLRQNVNTHICPTATCDVLWSGSEEAQPQDAW